MRRILTIAVGVLVLALATLPLGAAFADQPPAATYLALGDSLAVGVGATPEHQQDQFGYVGRFNHWFKDSREGPHDLVNVGMGGETSTSLVQSGQLSNALAAIADSDSDVQVVTLDIGGNDLRALLASGVCVPPAPSPACFSEVQNTLTTIATNHHIALGTLRAHLNAEDAAPETILVMGLYNPYKGTGAPIEGLADIVVGQFNYYVEQVATAYGARFVNVYPLFNPAPPLLAPDGYHANNDGYLAIAGAFEAAAQ